MTDRELLELAAKAAGMELAMYQSQEGALWLDRKHANPITHSRDWNPLTDDGDALRLAVKLNFFIQLLPDAVEVTPDQRDDNKFIVLSELLGNDPYAATRLAIVRAAAEIGKEMK